MPQLAARAVRNAERSRFLGIHALRQGLPTFSHRVEFPEMLPFPPEIIALVIGGFLLGGFSKGLIGLGLPVVVLAVIAAPLGVPSALSLLVVPAILTNLWQALDGGALFQILRRLWPFYLAASAGVWGGGFVLAGSSEETLLAILGFVLIVYSAISLISPPLPEPGKHERWMAPSAAFAGGLMFGMVGNFIVPGILYLQALGLKRDVLVQALGVNFIVISSTLALSLTSHSVITGELVLLSVLCGVPAAFAGMIFGRSVRKYVSESGFRKIFLFALLLTGIYTFVNALWR